LPSELGGVWVAGCWTGGVDPPELSEPPEEPGGVRPVGCGGGDLSPPLSASAGVLSESTNAHAQTAASLDGTEGMFKPSPTGRRLLSPEGSNGHLFDATAHALKSPQIAWKVAGLAPMAH
jgi:hypothetical protein